MLANRLALMAVAAVISLCAGAQNVHLTRKQVTVMKDGDVFEYAFAGGLNSPQFSAVDLNDDGRQDLYVFDRVGDVQLTFLRQADGSLVFAPEYADNFPELIHWVLLRDYDGDGIEDIFASHDSSFYGVQLYKGYYDSNNRIAFQRLTFGKPDPVLYYRIPPNSQSKIYITEVDYPAIDDLDCDGDLDILTFSFEGGFIEYYRNMSVEEGFGLDSLHFVLEEDCYGGIYETGVTPSLDLASAPGECAFDGLLGDDHVSFRHTGSTLLTLDMDGDSDKELMLGDLGYSTINLSINAGDCDQAWMNSQDPTFPSGGVPIEVAAFPAAFHLDVDNDGVRDLLASPNQKLNADDHENVWYYRNTGSEAIPDFIFQKKTFLVDEMLDMGTACNPAMIDYNADGLMDLVIGNYTFYELFGLNNTRLYLLENVGTANAPAFELVDEDYLGLNQFSSGTTNLAPTFGDLDGDGDWDALVGEQFGQLFFVENTAGAGNPATFAAPQYGYAGIDVGIASVPQIIDLNRDGLNDIIVGERVGNIDYFQNVGSMGNPQFISDETQAPNTKNLGDVNTNIPGYDAGYAAPWFVDLDGEYRLFAGTQFGQIEIYGNVEGNLAQGDEFSFLAENIEGFREGSFIQPLLFDWDNDQFLDLMVGNYRGGLSFFSTNIEIDGTVPTNSPEAEAVKLLLAPNPTDDLLRVSCSGLCPSGRASVFDMQGRLLWEGLLNSGETLSIDVADWSAGVYILRWVGEGGSTAKRFVVSR